MPMIVAAIASHFESALSVPSLDQIVTVVTPIVEHAPTACKVLQIGTYVGLAVLSWKEGHRPHAVLHGIAAVLASVVAAGSALAH